jgi:hypothetical protein
MDVIRSVTNPIRSLPLYPMIQTKAKYALCATVLSVLGPAFEVVGKYVPEFKEEIKSWEDGRRFSIGVLPRGPYITLEKRGDKIHYLGKGLQSPSISMFFKNLDSAVLMFVGMSGTHQAFAQNRIIVDGNLSHTMEVNRVVNIVETYLWIGPFLTNVLKRVPKLSLSQWINKGKVYMNLTPAIIKHLIK